MRTNIVRSESLMVSCDAVNGWSVVEIDGEVDAHTAPMIREVVINLLAEGHHHFVLDLNFVTFMDSMGLGVIVAITKRIREHEGSLRIASASGRILRIFDLSGMRESYEIFPSAGEATQSVPSPGSLAHWPRPSSE
ncbi:STAS domain-containing protein [Streptomyces sp. NPDC055059]|jgi:anti-sigma B factor antagonist|uniref:Anti-sigma factor antagonist n=1 Tax=Streptomyces sp. NBC_00119 TaxID=2975659 RepID=A0AAU1UL48_9ACTN|nr:MULTISPECIES: STAS domain-containing protein [unclassified Streptomyces]MCX4649698.1 STAS domain-containing protein [Streptomyces sp. NBC_01446]MCX5321093.1 STAS domain-containing protein [Streptomyces sp. NBC_00120]